jgi:hypothetical protein
MGLAKELVASIDSCAPAPAEVWLLNKMAINDRDEYQLTARA